MTDFERVMQYHKWLKDKCELEENLDTRRYPNAQPGDKILVVGDKYFWLYYYFRGNKLIDHWISE